MRASLNAMRATRLLLLLGLWLPGTAAFGGPMVHHIESVTPRAGAVGSTLEITLDGAFLKDPRGIVFFQPGIECVAVAPLPSLPEPRSTIHGGFIQDRVGATFRIAPDALPGVYPFKVRTGSELSTTATFVVTRYPCVDELETAQGTNDTPAAAQAVPLNSTVRGRIQSTQVADVDVYKVAAKAGEHVSVEVDSVWIADKFYADNEFDLTLRILDPDGKELARNDDSALHIQDPIASVVAPRDGDYFVEIKQRLLKGADRNFYTANIGNNRRPLALYPAGGKAGTPLRTTLLGDPQGPIVETVALSKTPGNQAYFGGMPSSLPLRVSAYENVLENGTAAPTAVPVLPAALNGVIGKAAEVDAYALNVKKGDRYRVRVFARSLGTPLDPRIAIRAEGEAAAEVEGDDATMADRGFPSVARQIQRKEMLDPSVIWEPKKDGAYQLEISDMRGIGSADSVYRIEVEPVMDRVDVFIHARVIDSVECPRLNSIAIPSGDRCCVTLYLADGQGSKYAGELDLVAEGLPPGVAMVAPRVRKGQRSVPVVFTAAGGTPLQGGIVRIKAVAAEGSPLESACQQSFAFVGHSGGHAWQSFSVDAFAFAVTEPPPYSIEVAAPKLALSQNGELPLAVRIHRRAGFDEPIELQADWTPDGVRGEPTVTIPSGQSEGVLRFFADNNAPPNQWLTAVTASTAGGSYYLGAGRIRTASAPFSLEVTEPFVSLKNKPAAVRRGDHAVVVWDVENKKAFPGTATATLLGLPKGTSVTNAPTLVAGATQLTFEVAADGEALLGQYRELACELTFTVNGQEVRQRLGKGILRVDPELRRTP